MSSVFQGQTIGEELRYCLESCKYELGTRHEWEVDQMAFSVIPRNRLGQADCLVYLLNRRLFSVLRIDPEAPRIESIGAGSSTGALAPTSGHPFMYLFDVTSQDLDLYAVPSVKSLEL